VGKITATMKNKIPLLKMYAYLLLKEVTNAFTVDGKTTF
jgi:hypothetical protein